MSGKCLSECMAVLKAMPHGSEQVWNNDLAPLYALVLRNVDDEVARRAINRAVMDCDWRPSPARFRRMVVEEVSPVPDAETVYAEIVWKAQHIGLAAQPVAGRPNIFLDGAPTVTHPVVARVIAYLGGWECICTGEANMAEGLRKQVRASHASVVEEWNREAGMQLLKPPDDRDRRYFMAYARFDIPLEADVEAPVVMLPAHRKNIRDDVFPSAIPEDVRDQMRKLASKVQMPKARAKDYMPNYREERTGPLPQVDLSKEERKKLEAEVKAAYAHLNEPGAPQ